MDLLLPVCAIEGEIAGWGRAENWEYFPSINKGGGKREIFGDLEGCGKNFCRLDFGDFGRLEDGRRKGVFCEAEAKGWRRFGWGCG